MTRFLVGVDVGKIVDHSTISVCEQLLRKMEELMPIRWKSENQPVLDIYKIRHLERFPLKTPYPEVVERLVRMMEEPRLRQEGRIIMDATGVGEPIADLLRANGLRPVSIKITGSQEVVKKNDRLYHVPKRDLVSALLVMVQSGRIKMAKEYYNKQGELVEWEIVNQLREELENFNYKINRETGKDTYEAAKEIVHDDLVTAVALPMWYALKGEYFRVRVRSKVAETADEEAGNWDPLAN